MGRPPRAEAGGVIYHVWNRANARHTLFEQAADYVAFEQVLEEAHERVAMRTLAYCVMPNHWHLVLWPRHDGDLSRFMAWLTLTHTNGGVPITSLPGPGTSIRADLNCFQSNTTSISSRCVAMWSETRCARAWSVRAEEWRFGSLWRRSQGARLGRG